MPFHRFPALLCPVIGLLHSPAAVHAQGYRGDCLPAQIDSVASNSPLCPGDPVALSVFTSGDVVGYSWSGPGTGEYFTFAGQWSLPEQVLGEYTIIAFGLCGNDTASTTVSAQGAGAGRDSLIRLCDDAAAVDLAAYLGVHAGGGTWSCGGNTHSGQFNPLADLPGDYVYTAPFPATCPGSAQTATITVMQIVLGPDSAISICGGDPAFALPQFLAPNATSGGEWFRLEFLALEPHGSIYDPALDSSGSFRYAVGNCFATITVDEVPLLPWFEDLDGDGFGDPGQVAWSCAEVPGWVQDSTDNCPQHFGRIGDPCDDGLAATANDSITADCACVGRLTTDVAERPHGDALPALWPNPNNGRRFMVQLSGSAPAEVTVLDAAGKLVLARQFPAPSGREPLAVDLHGALARGVYLVRVAQGGRTGLSRLVVQ